MSSELTRDWPQEASLAEHAHRVAEGLAHVEAHMQMPDDDRLQITFGLLAIGGLDAAVLAEGEAGAGKTRFGNLTLGGKHVRVDIETTDTGDTLFGYANPINRQERIDGDFTGKLTVDDPKAYLNELSHLPNTGMLHRLWDDDVLEINGEDIDMWNAVIYGTSNFPNNHRVHELDGAMRSRFAVEVLFGDAGSEFARDLHGRDLGATQSHNTDAAQGVLPNAAARANLREQVLKAYPLNGEEFGGYVTDMIEAINANPMLGGVSNTDKRLSSGWQQAVRARLLVKGAAERTRINAQEASRVAALVLPTIVTLSQRGKAELKTMLGVPKIEPLTEAIARRRLLASMAFRAVEAHEDFPEDNIQQKRDKFRGKYSYASANGQVDIIDEFVEKALEEGSNDTAPPTQPARPRRRFLGRS